ncbi:MAG: AAA family ATPase [bacterium]
MYEEYFEFDKKPFGKTPDPAFLYPSPVHEEALARLQYGAEERELTLLTGEIGTGKTLLSRILIDSLGDDYHPVLIINPRLSPNQFLRTLAGRMGVEEPAYQKTGLLEQLNRAIYEFYERGICPVIIIDEAQLIPTRPTFEEIRLLTNYQLDDLNLISLILIGQPELKKRLNNPTYAALRQRIGIQYHLMAMGRHDTEQYISCRLSIVGGNEDLFTGEAVDVVYEYSAGLPRVINNIASNALLAGFSKEVGQIGPDIIMDVVQDLDLVPSFSKPQGS